MSNVSKWDVSAPNNNQSPPNGWPEGQPPSSVNDCARENMAALARWFKDTNGSLTTGGSGNSYTLTTNNNNTSLADQSALMFVANRENTGAATLNVDALGSKTLRSGGVALSAGQITADTAYVVVYNAGQDAYDIIGSSSNNASLLTTGTLPDGRLSSNVPLLNSENTFSENMSITKGGPVFALFSNNADPDSGLWQEFVNSSGTFALRTRTDAGGGGEDAIQITRSGTSVTVVNFPNGSLQHGNSDVLTTAGSGISLSGPTVSVDSTVVRTSGSQTIGGAKTFTSDVTLSGTRTIDATTRLNITGSTVSAGESGGNLGFFGGSGTSKRTITGSRSNGQALGVLLSALEDYGLIVDNSSA